MKTLADYFGRAMFFVSVAGLCLVVVYMFMCCYGCSSPVAPDDTLKYSALDFNVEDAVKGDLNRETPSPDFQCFYIDPWNRVCVESKYAIYEAADLITGGKGCWPCI